MMHRSCVFISLCACATFGVISDVQPRQSVQDVSRVGTGYVHAIYTPDTISSLQNIVAQNCHKVAVRGGGYSQGGHTWSNHEDVVDMRHLSNVCDVDVVNKTVTVQAGASWAHVQKQLARHGLSVAVMQSYNDFSVGGTLSVNAHGRDIRYGPIIDSVESVRVITGNGQLVHADRYTNEDLFYAVIGGYGACGIIVEATLRVTEDVPLERHVHFMPIEDYKAFFFHQIACDDASILHNANLYPNDFDRVCSVTWRTTDKPVNTRSRMQEVPKWYKREYIPEFLFRRIPGLKKLRPYLERHLECNKTEQKPVVWRNYEMSHTVATLEAPTRAVSTNVLQEYFVPVRHLENFIARLRDIRHAYDINILNVSLRYVPADKESVMTYAPQDSFALVLYINILNTKGGCDYARAWTQELVEASLQCGGTFYLPYQRFAKHGQFRAAYPGYKELLQVKAAYDVRGVFSNSFLEEYLW